MGSDIKLSLSMQEEPRFVLEMKDGGSGSQVDLPLIPRTYFPAMEAGGISEDDGGDVETPDLIRSINKTPYRTGATIHSTDIPIKIFAYDENSSFIACSDSWLIGSISVPKCHRYRIVADSKNTRDNDSISIVDYDTIQNRFGLIFDALITRAE